MNLRRESDTRTPSLTAAAFRCDFPAWLTTRTERDRRIISEMVPNHRTVDLARRFGVGPGRISQLRAEYQFDRLRFCGELST